MSARALTAAERARGTRVVDASRWLAGALARGLMRVRVEGADNVPPGGVLLAVNHNSYLDGPLVFGVVPRPATFLIKAEAFVGIVGWYLRGIGQIPVRRGIAEREPLVTALAVLGEGGVVGIFPEGTRRVLSARQVDMSASEQKAMELQQVRHGIAYLALRSGRPVLPVACVGTERVLPKGRVLPRLRQDVTVAFGRPAQVAEPGERPTRAGIAATGARVQQLLADHLRDATTAAMAGLAAGPTAPAVVTASSTIPNGGATSGGVSTSSE